MEGVGQVKLPAHLGVVHLVLQPVPHLGVQELLHRSIPRRGEAEIQLRVKQG